MDDIKFGKKVIASPNEDGSVSIVEEGYWNGLDTIKESTRVSLYIDQQTVLKELVKCLELLKFDTPYIDIKLCLKDKKLYRLEKTWEVKRKKIVKP